MGSFLLRNLPVTRILMACTYTLDGLLRTIRRLTTDTKKTNDRDR